MGGGVVSGDDKSMKAQVKDSDGDDYEDLGDVDDMTANSTLNTHETKPKRNTFVKYKLGESDWKKAKVLSLQPKQSGKYKNWINVHVSDEEEPIAVNWDDVELWSELPYPEEVILLTADGNLAQEVIDAKGKEIENLINNGVYEEIPYTNQKTISS